MLLLYMDMNMNSMSCLRFDEEKKINLDVRKNIIKIVFILLSWIRRMYLSVIYFLSIFH